MHSTCNIMQGAYIQMCSPALCSCTSGFIWNVHNVEKYTCYCIISVQIVCDK